MTRLKQIVVIAGVVGAALAGMIIWGDMRLLQNIKAALRAKRIEEKLTDLRAAIKAVDSEMAKSDGILRQLGVDYEHAKGNITNATPEQIQQFYLEFFGK